MSSAPRRALLRFPEQNFDRAAPEAEPALGAVARMEDLRLGQPEELTLRYPNAKDCIREFCPPLNDAQRAACRRCGDDE